VNDDLAQSDDAFLARIDDAFEHSLDPIPGRLTVAAREAFGWRLADVELAELLFDSANDDLAGVRGISMQRRSFRFASGSFVIRVHLTSASMIIMIEPPMSVTCTVATSDATTEHRTDELGEIVIDAPELPVRLEVDLPSGRVVTPWITG
jgi:hypothetical protein